jgi:hypothetical protein
VITKQKAIAVCEKLGLVKRARKEIQFKFVYNGRTIMTTAVPKGKGELHIEDKIRNQLLLDRVQFASAIQCPFKEADYLEHLQRIGELPEVDPPRDQEPEQIRRGRRRSRR